MTTGRTESTDKKLKLSVVLPPGSDIDAVEVKISQEDPVTKVTTEKATLIQFREKIA